ncbi:MAG: hypothetical protein R3B69_00285 [Candidatus Paceibacterota bacterium]
MSSETSFWVLPLEIIKPAAITLGVLLLGIYIFIRLYVRRKMYTVTRGRRIVRRPARRGTSTFLIVSVVMLSVAAVFLLILLLLFA